MTSKQYLKKKNKIVKNVTGVTLIPKDQIVKHPFVELTEDLAILFKLPAVCCTYCQLYQEDSCKKCPMAKAGNKCRTLENDDADNTWSKANEIWTETSTVKNMKKLLKLVKRYNKEKGKKKGFK